MFKVILATVLFTSSAFAGSNHISINSNDVSIEQNIQCDGKLRISIKTDENGNTKKVMTCNDVDISDDQDASTEDDNSIVIDQ